MLSSGWLKNATNANKIETNRKSLKNWRSIQIVLREVLRFIPDQITARIIMSQRKQNFEMEKERYKVILDRIERRVVTC